MDDGLRNKRLIDEKKDSVIRFSHVGCRAFRLLDSSGHRTKAAVYAVGSLCISATLAEDSLKTCRRLRKNLSLAECESNILEFKVWV